MDLSSTYLHHVLQRIICPPCPMGLFPNPFPKTLPKTLLPFPYITMCTSHPPCPWYLCPDPSQCTSAPTDVLCIPVLTLYCLSIPEPRPVNAFAPIMFVLFTSAPIQFCFKFALILSCGARPRLHLYDPAPVPSSSLPYPVYN